MIIIISNMRNLFILVFFCVLSFTAYSQEDERYVPETDPLVLEKLEKCQYLNFGLFMQWGPYCKLGVVESCSI